MVDDEQEHEWQTSRKKVPQQVQLSNCPHSKIR